MRVASDRILEGLNAQQAEAVTCGLGPVMVLAGAGSGKTTVLTRRVAFIIREGFFRPREILAVTFTNKAAGEMKGRITELVDASSPWVGTFHSFGAYVLRHHAHLLGRTSSFTIYDEDDQLSIVKEILKSMNIDPKKVPPKAVAKHIENLKRQLANPGDIHPSSFFEKISLDVFKIYEKYLLSSNAFDFADLISGPIRIWLENPKILGRWQERFKYVLVDEFQDTDYAQYVLLKMLVAGHRNVFVVGDDDQSIYGWRGARVKNMMDFVRRDFKDARVIRLEVNYRSLPAILELANAVIINNSSRLGKTLKPARKGNATVELFVASDEREEAEFVASKIEELSTNYRYKDFAVLYRANWQSRVFEDVLRFHGIPTKVVGSLRFYERKEVKDIIAYLRFAVNPSSVVDLRRIINTPRRGIGPRTVSKIVEATERGGKALWEALKDLAKSNAAVRGFVKTMEEIMEQASKKAASGLIEFVLEKVDYVGYLEREFANFQERLENVLEIINMAKRFEEQSEEKGVRAFLEKMSLMSDVDTYDENVDAVALMTVHSAKGLEFPVVFVVGLEDGLFPIARDDDEEERRLFYVAITRAKDKVFLSRAESRMWHGRVVHLGPSRFLEEVPQHLVVRRLARWI